MERVKILLVIRWPVGGIRTFVRYFYRNLDRERYQLFITAPDVEEMECLLLDLDRVGVTYLPMEKGPGTLRFFRSVFKTVWGNNFDLVHSHGFTAGVCALLPSLLKRTRHMLTLHEPFNEDDFAGVSGGLKRSLFSLFLVLNERIHLVSNDARENITSCFTLLQKFSKKLVVIPSGVEVERFLAAPKREFRKELQLPGETFLIGYMGRFMQEKGFKYLVDAVEIMSRSSRLPKKPLVLTFGEDGYFREEKDAIAAKGLERYFAHLPFTDNIASALKGVDTVVMPSLWEACGLLSMEAMVSGVPFIGTDCIGLKEVLEDTPATVIPARDAGALARALLEEMENPSTARAREFSAIAAERFDVRTKAIALENLLRTVISTTERG